jgi:hypothetical protein
MLRRDFLRRSACGFGSLAFAALADEQARAAKTNPLAPRAPHHAPRAKRVIFLWMQGGPSQMDLFDHKPRLIAGDGGPVPFEMPKNREVPGLANARLMGPIAPLVRRGESGLWMSEMLPHLGEVADELCVLKAMQADSEAHAPAVRQLHSGHPQFVRPSIGSWVVYGLGTENENLPGFLTICPNVTGDGGSVQLYSNAFLPAVYQGTAVGQSSDAANATIRYLKDETIGEHAQRAQLDYLQQLNRAHLERLEADARMEGVIESFELAFRMQAAAPGLIDLKSESPATLALYGIGEKETDNFGRQCLLARRFAEAGVRFIQITDNGWDHHGAIRSALPTRCKAVDKPVAGLIRDLKARGLLEDTLLVWTGEFGRLPQSQDLSDGEAKPETYGRDHNPYGFTSWLAGGGVKPGFSYGVSDDFALHAVEQKVHMHDLHATILHCLGLDHERLTYRHLGRDFRLTDVFGRVVEEILT